MKRTDVFVGTISGEGWGYKRNLPVSVDVELRKSDGKRQTTEHGYVVDPVELSVTMSVWRPNRSEQIAGGATREYLRELVTFVPGFDAEKAAKLADLGDRWHLNAMRAACAHQMVEEGKTVSERLSTTAPCPVTGYKYGQAWLTEELPEGLQAELEALLP